MLIAWPFWIGLDSVEVFIGQLQLWRKARIYMGLREGPR